jgi:hypothetical protein
VFYMSKFCKPYIKALLLYNDETSVKLYSSVNLKLFYPIFTLLEEPFVSRRTWKVVGCLRTQLIYVRLDIVVFHTLQRCKNSQLSYQIPSVQANGRKTKWLCIITEKDAISHMSAPAEISCFFFYVDLWSVGLAFLLLMAIVSSTADTYFAYIF